MILVRRYSVSWPRGNNGERVAVLALGEAWEPYAASGDRAGRLYDEMPSTHSIAQATTSLLADHGVRHPHRVVYFDTEDLLDVTADTEAAYQQAEAKALRTGAAAEAARAIAANPPPQVTGTPKPRRRKAVSS